MRAALSRCCAFGVVFVACVVLAAPAFADPSVPTGLTAVVRNDHSVDLSWTWPSPTTYPDDLQLWRNGAEVADLSLTSTSYTDSPPNAGTAYTYQLVTVNSGVPTATPVPGVQVTTRADAPNAPTGIAATFAPGTNIATVTFTRGDEDSDVTYNVLASLTPGGAVVNSTTARYADVGTAASVTLDGFTSYTDYWFSVEAVEDAGDPPSDPGQTTPGANPANVKATSNDVTSPSFNGGVLSASRTSLGSITAIWPGASDSGTGVASYSICVDGGTCQSQAFDSLASTQSIPLTGVPDDGQSHTVSVVAIDGSGNTSLPITAPVFMPLLAAPQISFAGHTDGCGPLIPVLGSTDGTPGSPSGLGFQLFANGQPVGPGEVTGTPFAQVTLTAQASFGGDLSPLSPAVGVQVNDPTGPTTSPSIHGQADSSAGTETLSWDPVTADGAPVDSYQVTANVAGYQPPAGQLVPQSAQPQLQLTGLSPNVTYAVNVNAVDRCGRLSPQTPPFTFIVNDQTPPSVPTGLATSLTGTGTSVHLSWAPSTDNVQVGEYNVLRNGQKVWTTSSTSFDDTNLPQATTFTYRVVAVDTSGNPSAPSAAKQITTRDLTPPGPPGNLHGTAKSGVVTLTWGLASDNVGVAGYQVSRNGRLLATVTGTTYVDASAPAGTNEWEVVAVDAAGNQSPVRTYSLLTNGAGPQATKASALSFVPGVKRVRIGGKAGARVVLSFKLGQQFTPAVLRLHVLSGKATLRVSLPSGTGRTTAGERLGQKAAKKGTVLIPIGNMHPQTLRVVLTTTKGGLVTLAGPKGSKAPMIVPKA
jgi:large repetitive protein